MSQLTVPLHKKGSTQDRDNYRGIALLSIPGKVFCRVIQRRLAERADHLLRESQCGFRKEWGCIGQIFTLRALAEKTREFNTTLYLSFVDLRKAYDSVNRKALWMVLRKKYNLPTSWFAFYVHCIMVPGRMAGSQESLTSPLVSDRVMCLHPLCSTFSLTLSLRPLFHSTHTLESGCSTILEMS